VEEYRIGENGEIVERENSGMGLNSCLKIPENSSSSLPLELRSYKKR